jgi:hypothetical protein
MNGAQPLTHAQVEDLLAAYTAGETTPAERVAVERHLAACPQCRTSLAGVQRIRALLGMLAPEAERSLATSSQERAFRPVLPSARVEGGSSHGELQVQRKVVPMTPSSDSTSTVTPLRRFRLPAIVAAILVVVIAASVFVYERHSGGSGPQGIAGVGTATATTDAIFHDGAQSITPVPGAQSPIQSIGSYASVTSSGTQITPHDPTNVFQLNKSINIVAQTDGSVKAGDRFTVKWFFKGHEIATVLMGNCCLVQVQTSGTPMQLSFMFTSAVLGIYWAEISYNSALVDTLVMMVD